MKHRDNPIPEVKKHVVKELSEEMKKSRTILIASCRGLPGKQFHEIKKKLRGKAEMKVAKKTAVLRAIDSIEKGAIKNLKGQVQADIVLLFSDLDAFELSGMLLDSQSKRNAKPGDISPEDIEIEPKMTDLPPGPAISELGAVGLKVKVTDGKLEIIKGAVVAKKGNEIDDKVASVLGKLGISPIKVGFIPLAAYDANDDAVYVDIVIDKEGTLEAMKDMIGKALGFAVNIGYPAKETISYFISKAAMEEKALNALVSKGSTEEPAKETKTEEPKVEATAEEIKTETPVEESKDETQNTDTKEGQ